MRQAQQHKPLAAAQYRMSSVNLTRPTVVLDTNVVLDLTVFRNQKCMALAAAVATGRVRWIATPAMREELTHVLADGHLDPWRPDLAALWSHWDRHCVELSQSIPAAPRSRLRCSDPTDQKFIDLAVACGARWLLSHDRAVLRLARRLREHSVEAIQPHCWIMHYGCLEPQT